LYSEIRSFRDGNPDRPVFGTRDYEIPRDHVVPYARHTGWVDKKKGVLKKLDYYKNFEYYIITGQLAQLVRALVSHTIKKYYKFNKNNMSHLKREAKT